MGSDLFMNESKNEVGCPDCSWLGKLSDVISDIINGDVVSVCPRCRAFPLAGLKDPFDGEDLTPDAEEYEDQLYKPKLIKEVIPKPYRKL